MKTGQMIALTAAGWIALGGIALAQTTPSQQEAPRKPDPIEQQAPRGSKTKDMKQSDMKQPGTGSEAMASTSRGDDVKALQEKLKAEGYDAGAIDGVMGPQTKAALRKYQKAENLQVTGRLDEQSRTKLGLKGGGQQSR